MKENTIILGAGITGLSAGFVTGAQIYESSAIPGGICASYYVTRDGKKTFTRLDDETYRFEIGGGHWIFGADETVRSFINSLTPTSTYNRKSSVYFSDLNLSVPYPLQNNLYHLPTDIKEKALAEILNSKGRDISTLAGWLESSFGRTLCDLFFFQFHELYTAGLYKRIAPQDSFKTPINKELITKGADEKTPAVGYNASFIYPSGGLDELIGRMSGKCRVNYNKRTVRIDLDKRKIVFADGDSVIYEEAVSTLPLNKVMEMARLDAGRPDPFTSVLVVNIGARRGVKCPEDHWLYIPRSKSGFHRAGFYSNVDRSFLPAASRAANDRVSIYAEKTYPGGKRPKEGEIKKVCADIVKELKRWDFVSDVEVADPTWIETAYTWQWPGSKWREEAIGILSKHGIRQTGRYGKWHFQGIAESIKDGLAFKGA